MAAWAPMARDQSLSALPGEQTSLPLQDRQTRDAGELRNLCNETEVQMLVVGQPRDRRGEARKTCAKEISWRDQKRIKIIECGITAHDPSTTPRGSTYST